MSTITDLASADSGATSRTTINDNFDNLNTDKVEATQTVTLQNKTLDNTNTITVKDASLTIQDDGGTTKQAQFQANGITAGQTRTFIFPDANGTLTALGNDSTGTGNVVRATSPTIVTPTIASFANAGHNHQDAAGGAQLVATSVFASGTVPTARLGSGSATSSTFLRGDQTWASAAVTAKSGVFSKDMSTTTTNTIAHSLGKTPVFARATMIGFYGTNAHRAESTGATDGTNHRCVSWSNRSTALGSNNSSFPATSSTYDVIFELSSGNDNNAAITFDGTNIVFTWTLNGTVTGTAYVMWEVYG